MLNSNLLPHSLASSCIPRTFQEPFPEILLLLPEILEASSCASEPQFFTAMSHISSFKSHVNLMQIASNVTSLPNYSRLPFSFSFSSYSSFFSQILSSDAKRNVFIFLSSRWLSHPHSWDKQEDKQYTQTRQRCDKHLHQHIILLPWPYCLH